MRPPSPPPGPAKKPKKPTDPADSQGESTASDAPLPGDPDLGEETAPATADPTRYGDWSVKGRCIDF